MFLITKLLNSFHSLFSKQSSFRFEVRYTVTNTEEEDECNVCLKWQPENTDGMMAGMHNLDVDSLVCLQPSIRIGYVMCCDGDVM